MTNNTTTQEEDAVDGGNSATELVLAAGLFVLMVGVGASCKPALLRKMLASPKALKAAAVGVTCQFVIMPVVAFVFTLIFQVEAWTALGFVTVGAMPGGSSSNIYTLWAKGVLELSVFMTILSTLVAFAMTPLWIYIFARAMDEIDTSVLPFAEIALTFAFLAIPLCLGMCLNLLPCKAAIHKFIERFLNVAAILLFAAAMVAILLENPDALKEYGTWQTYLAGVLYFPVTTSIVYLFTSLIHFQPDVRRTMVMEIGFQNLVLAFAIGEQTVATQTQMNQALPFPLVCAALQYVWAGILIPIFRWQKRRNERNGIKDCDSDFIMESQWSDHDEDEQQVVDDESVEEAVVPNEKLPETQDDVTPEVSTVDAAVVPNEKTPETQDGLEVTA